jgi:hypothetical protein
MNYPLVPVIIPTKNRFNIVKGAIDNDNRSLVIIITVYLTKNEQ